MIYFLNDMINLVRDLRTLHKNKYELDADELSILQRYFGIVLGTPETYEQIGETKQITKQRVEQIIKRALIKLNLKETWHGKKNTSPTMNISSESGTLNTGERETDIPSEV